MIYLKNYSGNCWWCGNPANSKEHKIKRTDFVKVFGKGPFPDKNERPILVKDGMEIPIQSPKSDFLKFNDCFCKNCNNDRSSEMDNDYTAFMEYIRKHELKVFSDQLGAIQNVVLQKRYKLGTKDLNEQRRIFGTSCVKVRGAIEVERNQGLLHV